MLSIIVPVYNVEKFLPECIESILKQNYDNFELLLIDDGSTDSSGKICDIYSRQDNRIIVKHTDNKGVSEARNLGLSLAKGEYITFVDSDDYVSKDIYSENIAILEQDLSIDWLQIPINARPVKKFVLSDKKLIYDYWILKGKKITNFCWDKIYRASFFVGLSFPKGHVYEDRYLFADVLKQTKKVLLSDLGTYNYRFHSDQCTQQRGSKYLKDMIFANIHILQNLPRECKSAYLHCYWETLMLLCKISEDSDEYKELTDSLLMVFPSFVTILSAKAAFGIKCKLILILWKNLF